MKKNRANNTAGKKYIWSVTYSPKEDTDGCPNALLAWIQKVSAKAFVVQEHAGKKHVQAVLITRTKYSRSWGCTESKRLLTKLGRDLKKERDALDIHPHNDLAGACGYQDDHTVLFNSGFTEPELKKARKYYAKRLEYKWVRDQVNTMIQLSAPQAAAMKAWVMHAHPGWSEDEAEADMVKGGHIWPGMTDFSAFISACELRKQMES